MTVASEPQGGSSPPRLEANCTRHGAPLVLCDHCSNIHLMARWAGSLSGQELAAALRKLGLDRHWYAPSERQAILAEAARRVETDPVAYARAKLTSPGALALLDEVERGRARRQARVT